MNTIPFHNEVHSGVSEPVAIIEPDFSGLDSAEDIVLDAQRWGILDDLRRILVAETQEPRAAKPKIIRDIVYELAGAKNRDFAVDIFIHVTGVAEFGPTSLRDYARKHGCSHEWIRKEADAMRRRLGLPDPVSR